MLLSPEAIETVSDILDGSEFYREAHRDLFDAIKMVHERKEPVDVITLTNELKKRNVFDKIGGLNTLTSLGDRVPTAANAEFYANIVKEKRFARKLITAATQITADAYSDNQPIKEMMDMAEFRIFEATDRTDTQEFKAIGAVISDVFEEVSETSNKRHLITGIPVGFPEIDEMTEGMQPSNLVVIGARPSVGKTALALNIAWNCVSGENALKKPIAVGVFSLEMTENELAKRLLCSVAKVDWKKARRGELSESDRLRLSRATASIYEAPLYINDSDSLTIFQLKAEARRLKKNYDIKLLIVDYLQLIGAGVEKDTREQEVAFISRQLKALSKNLKIPVLCLSQLSRPQKGYEARKPMLSDLRESGAIEQDADVVIFIHRDKNEHELIVAKQRNGPIGEVPVRFQHWCTRFESMPKEAEEPQGVEEIIRKSQREWLD